MMIGKVVGSVVATRKNDSLVGCKLLIVEPLARMGSGRLVAVDNVGAGIGEVVLVATGSAARMDSKWNAAPVDAAIVGIVDNGVELE